MLRCHLILAGIIGAKMHWRIEEKIIILVLLYSSEPEVFYVKPNWKTLSLFSTWYKFTETA